MKNMSLVILLILGLLFCFSLNNIPKINAEDNNQSKPKEEENKPKESSGKEDQETISVKPKYYGIEMKSDHLIFVIDVTGSMETKLDMAVKEKAKNKLKATETGGNVEKKDEKKSEKDKKDAKKKREAGEGIDWEKITNHLDLARAEFIEAIKSLEPTVSFVAMTYNVKITLLQGNFALADAKTKDRVIKMIGVYKPEGATDAFFEALLKGVSYAKDKVPEKPKDAKKAKITGDDKDKTAKKKEEPKEAPYEVFFLTDGAPTINSQTNTILMPDDKIEENLKKLQEAVDKKNVCIHAIGIGYHNVQLMQKIAEIGKGEYVNMGPDDLQGPPPPPPK